ncbi:MAG: sugar phosphate nucleotidyltransferase [Bacteroidales bacterium]
MDISLLVLAAGMGSRYGGTKQLDHLGPAGETIMDYSVYDAIRAGFSKVVFVIREHFEAAFRKDFVEKWKGRVQVELVCQEIEAVPAGISYHQERTKPWGTAHAMLMAKGVIHEPFAVINADDFYGPESYALVADFLRGSSDSRSEEFCMAGYRLKNTLSDFGSVSRGICRVSKEDFLESVTEHTAIARDNDGHIHSHGEGSPVPLDPDDIVSMNFWGFTPGIFDHTDRMFREFIRERGQELKSEMYIPGLVDTLIKDGKATVRVLPTPARWFGVTYQEDRPRAVENIRKLVDAGAYPSPI